MRDQEEMTAIVRSSFLQRGRAFQISFPSFTVRITIESDRKLTVTVVAGDNTGFADTVDYEAIAVRSDVLLMSWQEHIGSTIVHVLDLAAGAAHSFVSPAKGGFMQLHGRIERNP